MHVRRLANDSVSLHVPVSLHVAVDERGIVCPFGELDAVGCERLTAAIDAGDVPRPLHLDLGGVTFIDSAGLRGLILLALAERVAGRHLVIEHPSPVVERLIALTGVAGLFAP